MNASKLLVLFIFVIELNVKYDNVTSISKCARRFGNALRLGFMWLLSR